MEQIREYVKVDDEYEKNTRIMLMPHSFVFLTSLIDHLQKFLRLSVLGPWICAPPN
jgi:hypothetical protein